MLVHSYVIIMRSLHNLTCILTQCNLAICFNFTYEQCSYVYSRFLYFIYLKPFHLDVITLFSNLRDNVLYVTHWAQHQDWTSSGRSKYVWTSCGRITHVQITYVRILNVQQTFSFGVVASRKRPSIKYVRIYLRTFDPTPSLFM